MNNLCLKTVLLLLFLVSLPTKTFAEDQKSEKKVIKTSFFTIELPERFTHLEGAENEKPDHIEGRFFANNKDYFPMTNRVPLGGSGFVIEYGSSTEDGNAQKITKSDEYQFIQKQLSFYNDGIAGEIKNSDKYRAIIKPTVLEQNKNFVTVHMSENINDFKPHMNIFAYTFLIKKLNIAVHYYYIDSNDEETGRKAAQEIYEQIKKTSMEITPPKASLQNQFNP